VAQASILLGVNFCAFGGDGALAAAITLLPLRRIGGFYFALATLGVNFVFFDIFHNLAPRVEGSEGLYGLQLPGLFASSGPRFAATLAIAVLCVLLCQRVVASPLGRALRATRDRPDALAALGKDPRRYQMVVWTFAGALTGLAGGLYAATLFISTDAVHARRLDPHPGLYRCRRARQHGGLGARRHPAHRLQRIAAVHRSAEPVRGAAAAGNVRASLDRSHDLPATRLDG
jgi:hypothetical protein